MFFPHINTIMMPTCVSFLRIISMHVIQKLQKITNRIGAAFVIQMTLVLLPMRDESLLMLSGLKYLLTNMVTSMVAALAQGSDPKYTEAAVAFYRLWAQWHHMENPYSHSLMSAAVSSGGWNSTIGSLLLQGSDEDSGLVSLCWIDCRCEETDAEINSLMPAGFPLSALVISWLGY